MAVAPILAVVVAASLTSAADAACQLVPLAELPTTGDRPVVTALLDGHPAQMLVETGSSDTDVWRAAAAAMHLEETVHRAGMTYGLGGAVSAGMVRLRDFRLGDFAPPVLRIHTYDQPAAPGAFVGVLGQSVFMKLDVEFDLAAGRIRLFQPQCHGDEVVYWASTYSVLELLYGPRPPAIAANVRLNGRQILATFASSASRSWVIGAVIDETGMAPETPLTPIGLAHVMGPEKVEAWAAGFTSLTIGEEAFQHPTLAIVGPRHGYRGANIGTYYSPNGRPRGAVFLGADFFRAHHIFVARSQGKIYFTSNGSPEFQPTAPGEILAILAP